MPSREETIRRLEKQGVRVVPRERVVSMFRSLGVELDDRPPTDEELEESDRILSKFKGSLSDMMVKRRGDA